MSEDIPYVKLCHNLEQEEANSGTDAESEEEEADDEKAGCILAHSMGLGKTLQTIAFLHSYHHHFPTHRSLLVMPKNVLHNWKEEFDKWLRIAHKGELTLDKV